MTVQELNELFGKNLKRYRKEKVWSVAELAGNMGLSKYTIYKYERGVYFASGPQLALLAYLLEVDVWKLFYEENKSTP
ncbi:MAG: helix-turn-helix domain-containing protein [Treponema sp.]|jgi:transcriptional regulator with XRE-family HTH domain|nr:helix-turn-helix domain-containing protein [Treponema sp.]